MWETLLSSTLMGPAKWAIMKLSDPAFLLAITGY